MVWLLVTVARRSNMEAAPRKREISRTGALTCMEEGGAVEEEGAPVCAGAAEEEAADMVAAEGWEGRREEWEGWDGRGRS
jgi:hypothetical protein